ncbi:hypothetical protein HYPSUDRAFT_47711 [Hypholoma sublateritium FD-334 SS-4]|uniref:SH3 domain-containing protein n=1 Tax=Hypholoma sublateritium (strain FD-334 SS-4) TaxID=945553 RepID=A0A0D2NHG6_HYPSF|nr:hypothetical protein HYPSUDRAFT_47711 [Hypholoma sublateritium FD-334 SS-4]
MASAVYSEPPASRLSIALEGEASASPFPSPSSSFLPPPTPGAHEFAVKPAPTNRIGRKLSATASAAAHASANGDGTPRSEPGPERTPLVDEEGNGHAQAAALAPTPKDTLRPGPLSPALASPTTPTPHTLQHHHPTHLEPPRSPGPGPEQSTSSATTPTILTSTLPPEEQQLATITIPSALEPGPGGSVSAPTSPAFSTFSATHSRPPSGAPSLSSWRAAPPSPALSRRVSGVPSLASTRSARASRPPSQALSLSRAGSLRKQPPSARASPVLAPHRLSLSTAPPPPPLSPQNLSFALNAPSSSSVTTPAATARPLSATPSSTAAARIVVRDFGFAPSDPRHSGLGPDVPKANSVRRLNRRLGARVSMGSVESSDGDEEEEVDDDAEWGASGLLGRLSWLGAAAAAAGSTDDDDDDGEARAGFPTQSDLDMNFGDADEGEEEEEEEPLYPGLYRAVYAFEPEGIAEMRLEEDQIVRVVGRGGGVGWAVVVDESAVPSAADREAAERTGVPCAPRHALVPEGYLEAVRLDWEDEEALAGAPEPAEGAAADADAAAGVGVAVSA